MLILILIDVQYLQNIIFSFDIGLKGQTQFSLDFHHQIKKIPPPKFTIPHPWTLTQCLWFLKITDFIKIIDF